MTTLPSHPAWMQTGQGVAFDYLQPKAKQVNVVDVAHALAHINRFCGHLTEPVNVAQHSLLVLKIVGTMFPGQPDWVLLQALIHDVPEAYIADIPAPLKRLLPDYQAVEARVWAACAERFGVPVSLAEVVKQADWEACRLEAWRGFRRDPLNGWAGENPLRDADDAVIEMLTRQRTPQEWTEAWLAEYGKLTRGRL